MSNLQTKQVTFTKRTTSPFRADVVGSYLRPEALKVARNKYEQHTISHEELTKVEDAAILDLIQKQVDVGLHVVTDGEFRRSWWHLDFFWGLNGIKKALSQEGYRFHGEVTRAETAKVAGKISGEKHPFVDHFKFVQAHAPKTVTIKQTIPSPAQLLAELQRPENVQSVEAVYANQTELVHDIVKAYQQVIQALYDAGCRTIQFDDCTWGMLASGNISGTKGSAAGTTTSDQTLLTKLKHQYVEINNEVIEGKPTDLTINTHVCRGNYHSHWASAGGYDSVADPLFNEENVTAYYLEYDSDRAGGFEPLKTVSEGKYVVLGLITSKDGQLEDVQTIKNRIQEATKYIDLDHLCVSTQCGFASTEEGNVLTEAQQWEKIKLVQTVAQQVWNE